jgi:hypothetical protein
MFKPTILFVALLLAMLPIIEAKAQGGPPPLTVALFNEATAMPFGQFLSTPVHPGIQVGSEFSWREGKHFRLYPVINIGWLLHQKLFQGVFVNAELGVDYKTGFGLNLKSKIGLGYLHTFTTQQEYQFEEGRFLSKRDRGNSRLMPSFSLGLGYALDKKNPRTTEIFTWYQTWLEYPYSPGFIPLMSHSSLYIGAKFYPHK